MTLLRKRFMLPALAALAVLCGLAVWMLTPSGYLAIDLRTCIHKRAVHTALFPFCFRSSFSQICPAMRFCTRQRPAWLHSFSQSCPAVRSHSSGRIAVLFTAGEVQQQMFPRGFRGRLGGLSRNVCSAWQTASVRQWALPLQSCYWQVSVRASKTMTSHTTSRGPRLY